MNAHRENRPVFTSGQLVTINGDREVLAVVTDVYEPALALLEREDGSRFKCKVEALHPHFDDAGLKTTAEDAPGATISEPLDPQHGGKVPNCADPQIGRSVSIDAAAMLLCVCKRTIYNRIKTGRLQTVRTLGGSQRVLIESMPVTRGRS